MLTFTPLLGAQSPSPASQSLLELEGGVKLLVDVGWDETFSSQQLKELERHVPTISLILLTHPTVSHIGAFAHCCKHFPLFTRIPIYATAPVISLGRTLLQDLYASSPLAATIIPNSALTDASYPYGTESSVGDSTILLQPPTAEEIAGYFSLINPLKYSQPHQPLSLPTLPPLNGLAITAYNAGHTLGGTIWHIQHGLESIVYAVDWNQARDNVFDSAAWLGGSGAGGTEVIEQLRKPTALICSSRGPAQTTVRKKRDDALLKLIREVVARNGTVLIPTDSSARVLELAYLLERSWGQAQAQKDGSDPIKQAKLYLASKNIGATMRYARSMLEWMDKSLERDIDQEANRTQGRDRPDSSGGPFDFRYCRLLERKSQLDRIFHKISTKTAPGVGRVILASDTSLDWGFSRDILPYISGDTQSLVILTDASAMIVNDRAPGAGGLGRLLWRSWYDQSTTLDISEVATSGEIFQCGGTEITISTANREQLNSTETYLYQQFLATQRKLQNTLRGNDKEMMTSAADAIDDGSSTSSSSEESDTQQGKALNVSRTLAQSNKHKIGLSEQDLGVNILLRGKGVFDFDVRGKKPRDRLFPYVSKRKRIDDFGEVIRPDEYLRAEERDQETKAGALLPDLKRQNSTNVDLGQKRKWDVKGDGQNSRQGNQKGQLNAGAGVGPDNGGAEYSSESESEPIEAEASGPSKVSVSTQTIKADFGIAFVDFSGIHDKRTLLNLMPLIKPRKIIFIAGMPDEVLSLATDCQKLPGTDWQGSNVEIFTPSIGQSINASVDTNAWGLKLGSSLAKELQWQDVRGLGVVHVLGQLVIRAKEESAEDGVASKKLKMSKEATRAIAENTPNLPSLESVPMGTALAARNLARPLHVGDIRLADLRRILQSGGHLAEFKGEGTLLVDGVVAVRKSGTGKIELEGTGQSSRVFNVVRRRIYDGLAVVAAG
ncbi:MAG: hypothetical protein M1814_004518 [Vezdaea aestivalis]|nr:MAG: hypothetical protein M1814_004518 [Vezdaea aestivalis]